MVGGRQNGPGAAVDVQLEYFAGLPGLLQLQNLQQKCRYREDEKGSCWCQEVLETVNELHQLGSGPTNAKLVLAALRVLGAVGAALIKGAHHLTVHLAVVDALHRWVLGYPQ
jgi:hypothetical protein